MAHPAAGQGTGIRGSDAEREQAAQSLRAATDQGLLTIDEMSERLASSYAARYRHEPAPPTADLPDGGRGLVATTPSPERSRT